MALDAVIKDVRDYRCMNIIPECMEPAPDLPADLSCLAVPLAFEIIERVGIVQQGICLAVDAACDLRMAERLAAEFINNPPACTGSGIREIGICAAQGTLKIDA